MMGKEVEYLGASGNGQLTKMVFPRVPYKVTYRWVIDYVPK